MIIYLYFHYCFPWTTDPPLIGLLYERLRLAYDRPADSGTGSPVNGSSVSKLSHFKFQTLTTTPLPSSINFRSQLSLIMKGLLAFVSLLGLSSAGSFQRCYPIRSQGQLDIRVEGTTSVLSYPISAAIHQSSIPRHINSAVLEKPESGLSVCTNAMFEADQCEGKGLWEFIYNTTKAEAFQSVFMGGTHVKHTIQVAEPGVHCLLFYRDLDSFSDVHIKLKQYEGPHAGGGLDVFPNRCHDVLFVLITGYSIIFCMCLGGMAFDQDVTVENYDHVSRESLLEECKFDEAERTGVRLTKPVAFYAGIIFIFRALMKLMQFSGVDQFSPFLPVYIMNITSLFALRSLVVTHTQVSRVWGKRAPMLLQHRASHRALINFLVWVYFWVGLFKVWEPLFRPLSPGKVDGALFALTDWICYLGYGLNIFFLYIHFFADSYREWRYMSPLRRRCLVLTSRIIRFLPLLLLAIAVIGQWAIQSHKHPQGGFHLTLGPLEHQLFTSGWGNGAFEYDPSPGALLQLFMYLPMVAEDITIIACVFAWKGLLFVRQRIWQEQNA